MAFRRSLVAFICVVAAASCRSPEPGAPASDTRSGSTSSRPSILLVTLDTTRADAIGPEARGVETPKLQRARGARPAIPSGVRDGAGDAALAQLDDDRPLSRRPRHPRERALSRRTRILSLAEQSARPPAIARRRSCRRSCCRDGSAWRADSMSTTTVCRAGRSSAVAGDDRRARWRTSRSTSAQPRFVWVHYFDPHTPYSPPEPFRRRHATQPYLGEVAAMDEQIGRLVDGVRAASRRGSSPAIIVAGDHGEGLGDHGELQHGNLLYQSTMHVPLLVMGPASTAGTSDTPVSTRRVFHTMLDWAGLDVRAQPARHRIGGRSRARRSDEAVPRATAGSRRSWRSRDGRRRSSPARTEVYDLRRRSRRDARSRRRRQPARARCARRSTTIPCRRRTRRARPRTRATKRAASSPASAM